jgi:hypothetical protein
VFSLLAYIVLFQLGSGNLTAAGLWQIHLSLHTVQMLLPRLKHHFFSPALVLLLHSYSIMYW